jgi:hypothetical protein
MRIGYRRGADNKERNMKEYITFAGYDYLKESSLNKIKGHAESGFFTISAFRRKNTLEENLDLNEKLQSDLKEL